MRLRILSIIIFLFTSVTILGVAMLPSQSATPTSVHPHHKALPASTLPRVGLTAVASTTMPTTTPQVPTTTTVPPQASPDLVTPADLYAAWSRVATCEEGGWVGYSGTAYPNSLGINATNWYGTASRIGADPSDMSPANQIKVAEALRAEYGMPIPDQSGCAPW